MPAVRFGQFANAANCQVVGFGAAGGEDNLVRACADKDCDLPPCAIGGGPRFLTEQVDARSVAKFFRQVWQHRFDDPRVDRRGGTMIEIDFAHSNRGLLKAATPRHI